MTPYQKHKSPACIRLAQDMKIRHLASNTIAVVIPRQVHSADGLTGATSVLMKSVFITPAATDTARRVAALAEATGSNRPAS